MRGQSFAGHALADCQQRGRVGIVSCWGSTRLLGFMAMAILAAGGMELVRVRRADERDLVTGIVLGAGLGLSALFLYFDVTSMSTTGAAITVMFGSMFAIPASIIPLALAVGLGALLVAAILYRPLLLSALDPELAAVRGGAGPPGRTAAPAGAGARRVAVRDHSRRRAVHSAADRAGRDRPAPGVAAGMGHRPWPC